MSFAYDLISLSTRPKYFYTCCSSFWCSYSIMICIWKLNVRDSRLSGTWVNMNKMLLLQLVGVRLPMISVISGNNFLMVL